MQISVTVDDGSRSALVQAADDMDLQDFKALCAAEFDMASTDSFRVISNGQAVNESGAKTLKSIGIADNDLVILQPVQSMSHPSGSSRGRGAPPPTAANGMGIDLPRLRSMLASNPQQLAILRRQSPQLAEAIERGNETEVAQLLSQYMMQQQMMARDNAPMDLFDPALQSQMYEQIQRENIEANFETAIEHIPESFGHVVMLYINAKINDQAVKAFVDSGAQMTIMSKKCAERCNLLKLLDIRFSGVARGVGLQKILGRVHICQLQIERDYFPCTLSVLDEQEMDLILGLDMLRRHQCCVDLKRNCLVIGSSGTETQFLPENDLPHWARLNREPSQEEHDQMMKDLAEQDRINGRASSKTDEQSAAGPSSKRPMSAVADTGTSSSGADFSDSAIEQITRKGFSRTEAIRMLQECGGNVNKALAQLLVRGLSARGGRKAS